MTLAHHSAPGANAGFSYQFERALYWLAQSPAGCVIGVETDDDVAVRGTDASLVLEQDKHSISEHAEPFGDRSKDLWNTLAIWIEALDTKEVADDTTRFLMVTNKVLPECIAQQIDRAESEAEIASCVAALEEAAKTPPKHIASLTQRVLRPASRTNLRKLILHCELADDSQATAGRELRKETLARLQLAQWCFADFDSIADELLGWLHKKGLGHMAAKKASMDSARSFC